MCRSWWGLHMVGWKKKTMRAFVFIITCQKEVKSCTSCFSAWSPWCARLLTACRGGEKSPARWCVQVEHNLTPGPDLAVLGINRTALQGVSIYGKSRKIKGLQARRVLIDSPSPWGALQGAFTGFLDWIASGLSRLTFLPVRWCY